MDAIVFYKRFMRRFSSHDDGFKPSSDDENKVDKDSRQESECKDQEKKDNVNSTNNVNAVGTNRVNVSENISSKLLFDPDMPALEDIGTFDFSNEDEDDGEMADMNNLETTIQVSPTPTTRVHKDHPLDQVIGDFHLATQTRNMSKNLEEYGFLVLFNKEKTIKTFKTACLLAFYFKKNPKRHKGDILLVQVYVDDIIFGSTRKELCITFERLMHEKFQMSSMGELTFFLGLQVKQKNDGIFISQDKYVGEILMKFGFTEVRNASTPMKTQKPLLKDEDGEEFWTTAKARTTNEEAQIHAKVDRKKVIISEASIRRDLQFVDEEGVDCLPIATIFEQLALMGTVASAIICLATNQKFNFSKWIFDSMGRKLDNIFRKILMYIRFIQVFLDKQLEGLSNHERKYVAPSHTKKIFRNMRRVGKGFSRNITPLFPTMVVQSQLGEGSAIPTDPQHTPTLLQPLSSQPQKTQKPRKAKRKDTQVPQLSGPIESVADEAVYKELDDSLVRAATTAYSLEAEKDNGGGSRCQDTMRDTIAQTRYERVSKLFNDSLLARGNILQSDEDRLKLNELMELCTTLQSRVLDLEQTKATQANEIDSLKRRVKKLEKNLGDDASKHGMISDIDADEDITLVSTHDDAEMFDAKIFDADQDLDDEEVFVAKQDRNVVEKEVDDAQVQVSTTATTPIISIDEVTLAQELAELKHTKPMAKAKGIVFYEPEESTTTTTTIPKPKSQDKAKIDADYQLAERLQVEEQQELNDKEKATLFMQLLKKRRKFFAAKRAKEKRNKPPTQAQQRKHMCTYLKNVEGKKLTDLKNKSFNSIQKMFDRAFKRVDTFVDFRTELIEDLKQLIKIIPEEEITIDDIPLAVKSLIVDWKIYKEGKKSYYQIIRAGGKSKMYIVLSHMLKDLTKKTWKTCTTCYYCQYNEGTAAQDEVSVAQELQRNIL
nr:putative ribonuclease H-like domain-containing protein [Tanacetum cinerariifolium]